MEINLLHISLTQEQNLGLAHSLLFAGLAIGCLKNKMNQYDDF